MSDITIELWAKYGHKRGYATAADGAKLGWIDLKTGTVTVENGANASVVTAALRAWSGASHADVAPFDLMAQPPLSTAEPTAAPSVIEPASLEEAFETLPDLGSNDTHSAPTPTPTVRVERPSAAEPTWTDLALHGPGELIRAEAAAKWEADKAESRLFAYGARLFNVKTEERAWRVGAKGEEIVGNRLEELERRGWRILHSVPVGARSSDIDHVVIGPGGVFTVNTKRHPNAKVWAGKHQIRVNGAPVDYLRNARFEATRASKLLTARAGFQIEAMSCLVFSGVAAVTVKQQPEGVKVLTASEVPRWFKKRPAMLTLEQVEAIYAVARRSDTWV